MSVKVRQRNRDRQSGVNNKSSVGDRVGDGDGDGDGDGGGDGDGCANAYFAGRATTKDVVNLEIIYDQR